MIRYRILGNAVSLLVATLICAGCGASSSTAAGTNPVATTSVSLQNTAFNPSAIVVSTGATVTFTNLDGFAHNVTFDNAAIGTTGNFSTGSLTRTMPVAAGTYTFHCTIHTVMTGSVKVQ